MHDHSGKYGLLYKGEPVPPSLRSQQWALHPDEMVHTLKRPDPPPPDTSYLRALSPVRRRLFDPDTGSPPKAPRLQEAQPHGSVLSLPVSKDPLPVPSRQPDRRYSTKLHPYDGVSEPLETFLARFDNFVTHFQ